MADEKFDVNVLSKSERHYEAVVNQDSKFDGLYPGDPWPSNHGDTPGNTDARELHGQRIEVLTEQLLDNGMSWCQFEHEGQLVWISREALQLRKKPVQYQKKNYMAFLRTENVIALYNKVPRSEPMAHKIAKFIRRGVFNHGVVQIVEEATVGNQFYVRVILGQHLFWMSSEYLYLTGNELPLFIFDADLNEITKGKSLNVPVTINYDAKTSIEAWANLSIQGNYTERFPRKNFEINLYRDKTMHDSLALKLFEWEHARSKFTLRADYTDPTHSRVNVAFSIWKDILATEKNYVAKIRDKEMLGTIQGYPVLLSHSGQAVGIYTLLTYFDADSLEMEPYNSNEILLLADNGYKDDKDLAFSKPFARLNASDFSLMSHQYFDDETMFANTNRLMAFIAEASDEDFKAHADEYFDYHNLIDYFLFVLAIDAYDNLAHNTTLFTYDGKYWMFSLIDLDVSFGVAADGYRVNEKVEPIVTDDTSPIWNRLQRVYATEIKQRWHELRADILTVRSILNKSVSVRKQVDDENIEIDHLVWHSVSKWLQQDDGYLKNYLAEHLAAVDEWIESLTE